MRQGELAMLVCRYDYAYGEEGSPPTIPAKSTLNFEVELFGWDDPEPDTAAQKIKAATVAKEAGNAFFKDGKFDLAIEQYDKGMSYFSEAWGFSDEEKKEMDAVKLPILLNLAAAQLKLKLYADSILNCNKALDIDSSNAKALFRKGQAHSRTNDFEKAKADLLEAIHLSPKSKEIRDEYEAVKQKEESYKQKERDMYKGLFNKKTVETKETPSEVKEPAKETQ